MGFDATKTPSWGVKWRQVECIGQSAWLCPLLYAVSSYLLSKHSSRHFKQPHLSFPSSAQWRFCLNNSQTDLQAAAGRENLTHNPDDVSLNLYCIVFLLTAVLWLGLPPSAVQVKVVTL